MKASIVLSMLILAFFIANLQMASAACEYATENDLILRSDCILYGDVLEKHSYWNEDHSLIFTDVKIHIKDILKGDIAGESIVITIPGGEIGDIGLKVSHQPEFEPGTEIIAFLKKSAENKFRVIYGDQGKLTVENNYVTERQESYESFKARIKSIINLEFEEGSGDE